MAGVSAEKNHGGMAQRIRARPAHPQQRVCGRRRVRASAFRDASLRAWRIALPAQIRQGSKRGRGNRGCCGAFSHTAQTAGGRVGADSRFQSKAGAARAAPGGGNQRENRDWGCKPKPQKFPSPVNFPVFDAWRASVEGAKAICGLDPLPKLSVLSLKYGKSRRETSTNRPRGKIWGLGLHPLEGVMAYSARWSRGVSGIQPRVA
jgi:hypothetical protein